MNEKLFLLLHCLPALALIAISRSLNIRRYSDLIIDSVVDSSASDGLKLIMLLMAGSVLYVAGHAGYHADSWAGKFLWSSQTEEHASWACRILPIDKACDQLNDEARWRSELLTRTTAADIERTIYRNRILLPQFTAITPSAEKSGVLARMKVMTRTKLLYQIRYPGEPSAIGEEKTTEVCRFAEFARPCAEANDPARWRAALASYMAPETDAVRFLYLRHHFFPDASGELSAARRTEGAKVARWMNAIAYAAAAYYWAGALLSLGLGITLAGGVLYGLWLLLATLFGAVLGF